MTTIYIKELFQTLIHINAAVADVAGQNAWRLPTGKTRLQTIDQELALEIPYAPSKDKGNKHSIWAKIHFGLALPALKKIQKKANNPQLEHFLLAHEKAKDYFFFLDELRYHLQIYNEFTSIFKDLLQTLPDNKKKLKKHLYSTAQKWQKQEHSKFLLGLLAHLPDSPTEVYNILTKLKTSFDPERHLDLWLSWLKELPDALEKLDVNLQFFLTKARENHIVGRILQTYYTDQKNYSYKSLGVPIEAEIYYAQEHKDTYRKTVFKRILEYYCKELPFCPIAASGPICAKNLVIFYSSWYQKTSVVEMITTGFLGAAEEGGERVGQFLQKIYQETKVDLRQIDIPTVHLQRNSNLLRRIGRLTLVMDILGQGENLRKLAKTIWPLSQRKRFWGNPLKYVPGAWQKFSLFRQDIAILFYAIGLYLEDHGHSQVAKKPKEIAWQIQKCQNRESIKKTISLYQKELDCISTLLKKSDTFCAISLTYIKFLFGLKEPNPIAISTKEILKGLPQLQYQNNILHVKYQEAKETLEFKIKLEKKLDAPQVLLYNHKIARKGLIYPGGYKLIFSCKTKVLLPKIGRESYDLLGKTQSAHAGEMIGYGCSVFHSTLQLVQLIAILLGAKREHLEYIYQQFFSINKFHQRHLLAKYQMEELLYIFQHKKPFCYLSWIQNNFLDKELPAHTKEYLTSIKENKKLDFDAYGKRMAYLTMLYPHLYPHSQKSRKKIDPRESFYNGKKVTFENKSDIELPFSLSFLHKE